MTIATSLREKFHTVLIMDEDPLFREISRSYLLSRGISDIHAADSGSRARKIVETLAEKLDLLLLDLNMPEFDGVEFLGFLREQNCRTPIVIISAADPSVRRASHGLAQGYGLDILGSLAKPLNSSALDDLLLGNF